MVVTDTAVIRPSQPSTPPPSTPQAAGIRALEDHLRLVDDLVQARLASVTTMWEEATHDREARRAAGVPSIDLAATIDAMVRSGGKRIRPTLALLGHRIGGGRGLPTDLVTLGAALELLHTFALVQDDVMDHSSTRRGRPTAHVQLADLHRERHGAGDSTRWGHSMAILAGDLAQAEAQDLMARVSPVVRRHWRLMVVELLHGQTRDLTGAAWRESDPERALTTARLKSGAYTIQRPLELGALVAGAGAATLDPLSEYGEHLGIAFALRDDVLGVWGDPTLTGKPAGDDLMEGKPTLIMALATQRLGDLPLLKRVGTATLTPSDVQQLQHLLVECGIRDEIENRIARHLSRGLSALDRLPRTDDDTDTDPVEALTTLAGRVAHRDC
ncbi:MAG TPA: polyprenyl synthetase family protein [Candidatus Avipropionibacterium avicola]|uniref:Polyprenyl synthetase family protein n=1 Tax=Candidatus Avipropionibacterium avicola TaxID=2840701 RepID=A0A9D1GXP0_9ACTN|nr:polyprenyl synthetase family protein [Candidatus Avipropionibacterium avicola]